MAATSIEWATHVWNPFTGCDRVSPGCAHCYALEYAARLRAMGQAKYQNDGDPKSSGPGFGFTVHWDQLEDPPTWPTGSRVFVNSMSDVFHERAQMLAISRLFAICNAQRDINFLILTKRAERMHYVLNNEGFWGLVDHWSSNIPGGRSRIAGEPLPNVWLGVSIENRRFVHRAELLRQTPAAVRFISAEPLLGPLVPDRKIIGPERPFPTVRWGWPDGHEGEIPGLDLTDIDWLIVGAESGAERRRFDIGWVTELRRRCLTEGGRSYEGLVCLACGERHQVLTPEAQGMVDRGELDYHDPGTPYPFACPHCGQPDQVFDRTHGGTAFFFKQGSAHRPGQHRELDGRTWDELPERPDGGTVRTAKELATA